MKHLYQKGNQYGRPKGSKNKKTLELKEWIKDVINNDRNKLEKELGELTGLKYVEKYIALLEFVIPKAKDTSEENSTGETIILFERYANNG